MFGGPTGANGDQRYATKFGDKRYTTNSEANGGQWGPTLHYQIWPAGNNPLCFSL
jgi:hypothetical protein